MNEDKRTRLHEESIYHASIEAVVMFHGDLTCREAAKLADVPLLFVPGSMRQLCNRGIVEPREPRTCSQTGRRSVAYVRAAKRQGCKS